MISRDLRRIAGSLTALVGALMSACSAAPPAAPGPSLLERVRATETQEELATWRYHPSVPAPLWSVLALPNGNTLYVGDRGERWLVAERTLGAPDLAPEALVMAWAAGEEIVFVGRSGTSYAAPQPLADFSAVRAPPEPLLGVRSAGGKLFGLTARGAILRSRDAGSTWEKLDVSGPGAEAHRFVDVVLNDAGQGLALAAPERVFATRDGGEHWQELAREPQGSVALESRAEGIFVLGALGAQRWESEPGTFVPAPVPAVPNARLSLPKPPDRGANAAAVQEGRAAWVRGQYYELDRALEEPKRWELWSGRFGERLDRAPRPELTGCAGVRLSMLGNRAAVLCARDSLSEPEQRLDVLLGTLGSAPLAEVARAVRGRFTEARFVLSAAGVLVSGVCGAVAERGCKPRGIQRLHTEPPRGSKKSSPRWTSVAVPALAGLPDALSATPDGRTVVAVGALAKSGRLALFTSTNGGAEFDVRELALGASRPPPEVGRERRLAESPLLTLGVARDGSVGLVWQREGLPEWVTVDAEGRVIGQARAPSRAPLMAAVGARALAVLPRTGESWESADAGASWSPAGRAGAKLCPGDPNCRVPLVCSEAGCVLGDELSRVGWGGPRRPTRSVAANPSEPKYEPPPREPLVCVLEDSPWLALEGTGELPNANQAALGTTAWFAEGHDPDRASAWLHRMSWGRASRPERRVLLAPVARPEDFAFASTLQVEGAAAVRFPVRGGELVNLEAGWVNLVEDRSYAARLASAGTLLPVDYQTTAAAARAARPALISVAPGGLFLRPHGTGRDAQATYFLDGKQSVELPAVRWPVGVSLSEMTAVERAPVPFAVTASGAQLLVARRVGSTWSFHAKAIGLAKPAAWGVLQEWDIAYSGAQPGVALVWHQRAGAYERAWFHPFAAAGVTGTPVPLGTVLDAGVRPRACTEEERARTPRWVSPRVGLARHLVIVQEGAEPVRVFATERGVVHGPPEATCVAALDGERIGAVARDGAEEGLLVFPGQLDHSYLFRRIPARETSGGPPGKGRDGAVEVRALACRFDPSAEIPEEALGSSDQDDSE
jgi:hypothetical protein